MENLYIIANPVAGAGKCMGMLKEFLKLLDKSDIKYTLMKSRKKGHCAQLARYAIEEGADCVAIAGGDGTVREVLGALLYEDVKLLILPFGTGNDFARYLNLSDNPLELFEILKRQRYREIDAAMANDSFFLNVAGFGFDVEVLIQTEKFKKRFRDRIAYVFGLIRALVHLKGHKVAVKINGQNFILKSVLIASVGNGSYIGGGMAAHPRAEIDDGLLDVCIINDVKLYRIPKVLLSFIKGNHLELKETKYFRTNFVKMYSENELPVQLDGEIIEKTPVGFKILQNSIKLMI